MSTWLKGKIITPFLNHVLISNWTAALSSALPISTIKCNSPLAACHTTWLPKTPNHYIFTLKMTTAVFVETLDNIQHSTHIIHKSRSRTLKPKDKIILKMRLPLLRIREIWNSNIGQETTYSD
jgi:hypothetical protein